MKAIEKTITVFEANDGKVFETAEECEHYELCNRMKEIKMFNEDFEPSSYNGSYYLMIRDERDVQIIEAYCDEWGMYSPWKQNWNTHNSIVSKDFRGVLVYEGDSWVPLEDKIADLMRQNKRILELCSQ